MMIIYVHKSSQKKVAPSYLTFHPNMCTVMRSTILSLFTLMKLSKSEDMILDCCNVLVVVICIHDIVTTITLLANYPPP